MSVDVIDLTPPSPPDAPEVIEVTPFNAHAGGGLTIMIPANAIQGNLSLFQLVQPGPALGLRVQGRANALENTQVRAFDSTDFDDLVGSFPLSLNVFEVRSSLGETHSNFWTNLARLLPDRTSTTAGILNDPQDLALAVSGTNISAIEAKNWTIV